MRPPEFEASLAEARQYPALWRLLTGLALALLIWMGTSALIVLAGSGVIAAREGAFGVMPWVTGLATPASPWQVVVLLATFVGLFIGALTAAAALHFRGPGSLFGPAGDWWRGFLTVIAVAAPIYVVLVGLQFWLEAPAPNLAPGRWLAFLPLAVVLVFVQTGAEELLFRGYLQQQLAVRFRARWVWMGLPAALFAVLHWNPEAGANLPLVLLAALAFGLIAADLTARTGSLGAAMGLHFANNAVALLVVSVEGTITGLALYVSEAELDRLGPVTLGMGLSILILAAIWRIAARLLAR
jgi:hypothetical protein